MRIENVPVWLDPVDIGSAKVVSPAGAAGGLPTLYLLHGIKDSPADWWSGKGQMGGLLAGVAARPMVLVMIANGTSAHEEPLLASVRDELEAARTAVNARYQSDQQRQGILGISMGAKQALSILLGDEQRAGFSVLGMLSGMFQGDHLNQVHGDFATWPANVGPTLRLYFHYCGNGVTVPEDKPATTGRLGDDTFLENNRRVWERLGGAHVYLRQDGMHNWWYWRPALVEFFRLLNAVW